MESAEERVWKFIHWVKTTPHRSLTGDSKVAYEAQVRVLKQLEWYMYHADDYLEACCDWAWKNKKESDYD